MFWRNYFYRVSLIKQSAQLTALAAQQQAARKDGKSHGREEASPLTGIFREHCEQDSSFKNILSLETLMSMSSYVPEMSSLGGKWIFFLLLLLSLILLNTSSPGSSWLYYLFLILVLLYFFLFSSPLITSHLSFLSFPFTLWLFIPSVLHQVSPLLFSVSQSSIQPDVPQDYKSRAELSSIPP